MADTRSLCTKFFVEKVTLTVVKRVNIFGEYQWLIYLAFHAFAFSGQIIYQ